ncbi:hypothetical protein [Candidatus Ichthyocystis hellenicum]|nr:hypothetical protein [Candidatus Ichthyocystis hellenicum]
MEIITELYFLLEMFNVFEIKLCNCKEVDSSGLHDALLGFIIFMR